MHFGATLRLLRTDAGISLRSLASMIGVSSAYLSRVENGHDAIPTPDRLIAIARALGLPPHVLIELGQKVSPVVAGYLDRVPAASSLFLDIARRDLTGPQLARVQAFIDREFPMSAAEETRAPRLSALLSPDRVILGLSCSHFDDVIDITATRLVGEGARTDAAAVARAMLLREQEAPSALGKGVAVPHAVVPDLPPRAALVTLRQPLSAPTPDGEPLLLVVALVLNEAGGRQLRTLAQVAHLAKARLVDELKKLRSGREVLQLLEAHGL